MTLLFPSLTVASFGSMLVTVLTFPADTSRVSIAVFPDSEMPIRRTFLARDAGEEMSLSRTAASLRVHVWDRRSLTESEEYEQNGHCRRTRRIVCIVHNLLNQVVERREFVRSDLLLHLVHEEGDEQPDERDAGTCARRSHDDANPVPADCVNDSLTTSD